MVPGFGAPHHDEVHDLLDPAEDEARGNLGITGRRQPHPPSGFEGDHQRVDHLVVEGVELLVALLVETDGVVDEDGRHLPLLGQEGEDPGDVPLQLLVGGRRLFLQLDPTDAVPEGHDELVDQFVEERSLAVEVEVEGPAGDPRGQDDVGHRSIVITPRGKQLARGSKDLATSMSWFHMPGPMDSLD